MITGHPPHPFSLANRATAVVVINKYRCDLGDRRTPSRLRLGLGSEGRELALSLAPTTREMSWCGSGDPGSIIDTTPFEPSIQAARR
jgi:hypothetical protein